MNKQISMFFVLCSVLFVLSSPVSAAAPDGSGPWADEVVTSSQGLMKNGQPVPAIRSNPQSAVGPAENDNTDGYFFSLGFGGSITLKFDNGVRDGVVVVESTWAGYPSEKAKIEVSPDGSSWTVAGNVTQDGQVNMPDSVSCVNYVRITDISTANEFPDEIADGYDVDGVKAVDADQCGGGNTGGGATPTPTPSTTQNPTPTPTKGDSSSSDNSSGSSNSSSQQCTSGKPGIPSITSSTRTSATTVSLTWTAVNPVTTYAISYGTSPGNYQYGVPSTGNVTSFVVGGLDPNATYYFQVRGVNDCMPGDASGEQSTGQVLGAATGGQVLGATTDVLGATGSLGQSIATALSILGGMLSFAVYKKTSR